MTIWLFPADDTEDRDRACKYLTTIRSTCGAGEINMLCSGSYSYSYSYSCSYSYSPLVLVLVLATRKSLFEIPYNTQSRTSRAWRRRRSRDGSPACGREMARVLESRVTGGEYEHSTSTSTASGEYEHEWRVRARARVRARVGVRVRARVASTSRSTGEEVDWKSTFFTSLSCAPCSNSKLKPTTEDAEITEAQAGRVWCRSRAICQRESAFPHPRCPLCPL